MIEQITHKLRKGCREPLWQFIAIGSAAFLLYGEVAPKDHRIPISRAHVAGLRQDPLRRTGLPPTPEEESALIEKMEFLLESLNPVPEPTEAELHPDPRSWRCARRISGTVRGRP